MARYDFHLDGEKPHRDDLGAELRDEREAWQECWGERGLVTHEQLQTDVREIKQGKKKPQRSEGAELGA